MFRFVEYSGLDLLSQWISSLGGGSNSIGPPFSVDLPSPWLFGLRSSVSVDLSYLANHVTDWVFFFGGCLVLLDLQAVSAPTQRLSLCALQDT